MKRNLTTAIALIALLSAVAVGIALAGAQDELKQVRVATGRFPSPAQAEESGYTLVPGLDHCFFQPSIGGMGFHYIHTASLDTQLDPLAPEAMVYFPNAGGQLQLGSVEYIVPADAWAAAGNTAPPSVLGQDLHLNSALGVWVLHA
jgi:hypothetical protein